MNPGYRPITYIPARRFDSIIAKGLYFVPSVAENGAKTTSLPKLTDAVWQTQLVTMSHAKKFQITQLKVWRHLLDSLDAFRSDRLHLSRSQASHGWHPHLYVSTQASWQRASILRLSAVSAKLQGSCFFCSSIFGCVNVAKRGGAERWIRRETEREKEEKKHPSAP